MKTATLAQDLATILDDGQNWHGPSGQHLDEIARKLGGRKVERDSDTYRWQFPDGSAIVCAGAGWDFPISEDEDCFCWVGGGPEHVDGCPVALAARRIPVSAVRVDTVRYECSHGRKPYGPGMWAFEIEGEIFWAGPAQLYSAAAAAAKREAAKRGEYSITAAP